MNIIGLTKRIYHFSKIYKTAIEAVEGIKDGHFLLVGGFGICGIPMNLINALKESNIKNLTIASNNCGVGDETGEKDWGLAVLLRNRQIKRMISSYVGQNTQFQRQYFGGELELEICPQGTLAQKISSGGKGIPAFYTATGVGTVVEEGGFPIKFKKGKPQHQILSKPKLTQVFNGRKYVRQQTIFGDYALVKALKADEMGNLVFNKSARNFNADMCTAAHCVIAEVQEIVPAGSIDPDQVHVPGIFVNRIFKSDPNSKYSTKRIQKLTVSSPQVKKKVETPQKAAQREKRQRDRLKIMKRAAKEVKTGMNVNLGIGIPTLLPSVLGNDVKINLQSQNGILGVGPYPEKGKQIADLINAGKETVTVLEGPSFFSSSQSFGIIRGGHLDVTMLGSLQVSRKGDIANWIIPGKMMKGMGGAMDLVSCGSKVIVVMEHFAKKNQKKLLQQCSLPLTAKGVVSMVITQLGVFQKRQDGLVLIQIAQGITLEQIQSHTGFKITVADNLRIF